MSFLTLIASLILLGVSVYLFVSILLKQNKDAEALAWAEGNEPGDSKFPLIEFSRPLVHNFTLNHVKKVRAPKYRKAIEKKILTAGLNKVLNVDEFLGLQILWGIMFPILFTILNLSLQIGFPPMSSFIMSLVGLYMPHAYCNSRKKERELSIRGDLPVFVDILALSTEAGLDLVGAMQRITDKAHKDSVLAEEFLRVLKDLKLGETRKQAFTNLEARIDMPEVKSVVTVIKDADETGASIAETLKAKSKQMRFERFTKAEEEGAKASQKILIPMMIFIIPAVFVIVFAPVALQFLGGGS